MISYRPSVIFMQLRVFEGRVRVTPFRTKVKTGSGCMRQGRGQQLIALARARSNITANALAESS